MSNDKSHLRTQAGKVRGLKVRPRSLCGAYAVLAGVTAAGGVQAQTAPATELAAFQAWKACIVRKAAAFEVSGETPSDVATASLSACEAGEVDYAAQTVVDRHQIDLAATRQSLRDKAIAETVKVRACKRGQREACLSVN